MTYTLYSMQNSGNCYKPRLLMHQLGLAVPAGRHRFLRRQTRTPEYLALNPNGKVPLLVLPDGRKLAESNAMLLHLAEGTRYLPADRYERALCYQWLFFEQYSHEPYIAVARSWLQPDARRARKMTAERLADLHARGYKALGVMEERLGEAPWFAGGSLFRRRHRALRLYPRRRRGGFDLAPYPAHPRLALAGSPR